MGIKEHGYYGFAFVGSRPTQIVSLIAVIGMVGNFIAEIAKTKQRAPPELIGTIVMSCITILWTILSVTAYDDDHIPYLATCAIDIVLLIPFIVFAALLGNPLSIVSCGDLPKATSTLNTTVILLQSSPNKLPGSVMTLTNFVDAEQTLCYESMAVWGLLIALCVLFAVSAFAAGLLFIGKRRLQRAQNPPSPPVGGGAGDIQPNGRPKLSLQTPGYASETGSFVSVEKPRNPYDDFQFEAQHDDGRYHQNRPQTLPYPRSEVDMEAGPGDRQ